MQGNNRFIGTHTQLAEGLLTGTFSLEKGTLCSSILTLFPFSTSLFISMF